MKLNIADYVIIFILVVLFVFSIVAIRRNKGKCAYCNHKNCPFKKQG